ncbi:Sugar transporter ERD6 [Frankliniella fusca]|nr:Sugar transporter ERD6 [Frankliniella fusca]
MEACLGLVIWVVPEVCAAHGARCKESGPGWICLALQQVSKYVKCTRLFMVC